MAKVSVKNPKLLEVADRQASQVFFGGWQEWYGEWWKRMAGCGPTVVSTIVSYISRRGEAESDAGAMDKEQFVRLMEEVWRFVTPSVGGIPTTDALMRGASAYLEHIGLALRLEDIQIPKNRLLRPPLKEVLEFVAGGLAADAPLAFLSLDRGEESALDTWHWTVLVSLEYEEEGRFAVAEIADEGRLFRADLKKWYETTSRGGGFVRFLPADSISASKP